VEHGLEDELTKIFHPQSGATPNGLEPNFVRRFLESLRSLIGEQAKLASPVLLCSSPARFHLRRLLEPFLPKIVVLSPGEIPPAVPVQSIGMIR